MSNALQLMTNFDDDWEDVHVSLGLREGYQVSRDARVRGQRGGLITPTQKHNRLYVSLVQVSGKSTTKPLDLLVLSAHGGYEPGHRPEHKDGNTLNCHADNLKWSDKPHKRGERPKKATPAPERKTSRISRTHKISDGVDTYRSYLLDDVLMMVKDDGSGILSVGARDSEEIATMDLSAGQLRALTRVAARIAEMNHLMGIV